MILIGKIAQRLAVIALLLTISICSFAQGQLRGSVTDAMTGDPLIGATVMLVGTYKGAATDFDGNYKIQDIKAGDYSVKISFVGYAEKVFNGVTIENGKIEKLNGQLTLRSQTLKAVTVVGEKNLVNLESASSEVKVSQEEIQEMNVRDVQEVVAMQAGVNKTQDGLQIRGARVYETQYMVDGISAQDPLAGTGFGVQVSSSSVGDIQVITGGAGAEFGDGSAGVISTRIREGGDKIEVAGSWQRDNIGFDRDAAYSWNTDIAEFSVGGPVPFTKKKLKFFTNASMRLSDNYFGPTAGQLHSSLFPNNDSLWAPRQANSWSHTIKLSYDIQPGTKLTFTNQHSLNINQNTRTLQIVGFDAILQPGFQFRRSLDLNNATTYTHHSNLTALNFNHFFTNTFNMSMSAGRLFTNLRADANGRDFRTETVDRILDEDDIITDPVELFNPDDEVIFTNPGPWFINNGGIAGTWHDHYVEEYTIKYKFSYYPKNETHKFTFGHEHKFTEYQWVDVFKPWVGAPIEINDELTTPSISIGASNDIWAVSPMNGGLFVQDVISYKGIVATLGMRLNYWAPGQFADDAVNNDNSPVVDQVRQDYMDDTFGMLGLRWKSRLLPKINVSFPVTDNNVLYFNYGHSMRLPHPRFVYQGLDPEYQERSFLSQLGNPNLNPEVNVSYELGLKSQITKDLGITLTAFNNNRFDYIVSRRVLVEDQTGRIVARRMYINQDYAKIIGLEGGVFARVGKHLKGFFNVTYQVARGKSNSARESGLQIEQNGEVELTSEQYLAWDRPWDLKAGITFAPDSTLKVFGVALTGFQAFLSSSFTSGFRYTPQIYEGENELGRPLYRPDLDNFLEGQGSPWYNTDLKLSKTFWFKTGQSGVTISLEVRNLFNNQNAQVINPITGRAWEPGDDLPENFRDVRYLGPEENGAVPGDPARYLAPRQILYGISFRF